MVVHTAEMLLASDIPRDFFQDYLTNRAAMHNLYQNGFAAAEVVIHLSKEYGEQTAQGKAESKRLKSRSEKTGLQENRDRQQ